MISPTINLNGSSASDLVDPRIAAYDALQDAIKALARVCPHGRDYPSDTDRFSADYLAHFFRLQQIHVIATEIVAEIVAIQQQ